MKKQYTQRGFGLITMLSYPDGVEERVIQVSSAASAPHLWVGENHHLNRAEVIDLIKYLNIWLATETFDEVYLND